MTSSFRFVLAAACALAAGVSVHAISSSSAGDLVRAQIVINKVLQVVDKYRTLTVELEAPQPIANNSGAYLLPYKANGEMTEWASRTLNVAAGKVVGEKAGEAAGKALASKVPFGGLASGLLKKKTKEVAATAVMGGPKFIKKSSDQSFANLNDYALYLHVRHGSSANYKQALAAAMALYPDLEGTFDGAIQNAYRTQAAKAGKPATPTVAANSKN